MELTLVLLSSSLLGLGLARRTYLGLLVLPLLLAFSGLDGRILGLGGGLAVLIVGEILQRRWRHPLVKLVSILLAGAVAYHFGFRISFVTNPEGGFIYLSSLSLPLTLGWIAAVSYSLSLIDSLRDSLALKVALIAALTFLMVGLLQGQSLEFALALTIGLTGLALGWLLRGRERIPVGGIGFVLALISIAGVLKTTASLALLGPLLGLGLPLSTAALPIAYGEAQRAILLRVLRRHGLLIYLLASYLSVGLVLLARAPRPAALLILSGTALSGAFLWRWSRVLSDGFAVTDVHLRLFRVPLARLSLQEAVDRLELWLRLGKQAIVATPDTTALWRAQRDPRLMEAYQRADLVTPDGIGLVWASRLLSAPLPERVTGIDMTEELCRRAALRDWRIFLLGGRPGVAAEAKVRLEREFPGLRIVGIHHGFFAGDDEVISKINATQPEILLVGLGVPRQELWMLKNKDKLEAKLLIGVGGSFDVLSGRLPRAPLPLQRLGLEWFYRLMLQPWRIRRALAIPAFLLSVLWLGLVQGSPTWTKSSSSS
jgi:N-acetylglucosaminyldiphosphoundecaprenol N-acetyl-beta-D-mannosaminyltransferase